LLSLTYWLFRETAWQRGVVSLFLAVMLLGGWTWGMNRAINVYAHAEFYPVTILKKLLINFHLPGYFVLTDGGVAHAAGHGDVAAASLPGVKEDVRKKARVMSERMAEIIANHPGDLRETKNFLVYGGVLLWLALIAGVAGMVGCVAGFGRRCEPDRLPWDLLAAGISYTLVSAWLLQTAPDARFFLPGLPFLLLPLVEYAVSLPRAKALLVLLVSLAVLQSGYVLAKTWQLRSVSPGLKEAITFLEENPPTPRTVFMYPEGNYRLFSVDHRWDLNYHLREFWRADNDLRIAILQRFGIGAIVVKKHLIAEVDEAITNLGVYPTYFVRQIDQDPRFKKVFDNPAAAIYLIPPR